MTSDDIPDEMPGDDIPKEPTAAVEPAEPVDDILAELTADEIPGRDLVPVVQDDEPGDELPAVEDDIPDAWRGLSAELRWVFRDGEEAMRTHQDGLSRIFRIGRTLFEIQEEAKRQAHSLNPKGVQYNAAWTRLVEPLPKISAVNGPGKSSKTDKNDRGHYIWCYRNRDDVEHWWRPIPQNQRDKWNTPATIRRQYDKAHGLVVKKPGAGTGRIKAALADKHDEVDEVVEELAAAKTKIERLQRELDGAVLIKPGDTYEDMARSYYARLPQRSRPYVIRIMQRLLEEDSRSSRQMEKPTTTTTPGGTRRARLDDSTAGPPA